MTKSISDLSILSVTSRVCNCLASPDNAHSIRDRVLVAHAVSRNVRIRGVWLRRVSATTSYTLDRGSAKPTSICIGCCLDLSSISRAQLG